MLQTPPLQVDLSTLREVSVSLLPNGSLRQTLPASRRLKHGDTTETSRTLYPQGYVIVQYANGSSSVLCADGTAFHHDGAGKRTWVCPNGDRTLYQPGSSEQALPKLTVLTRTDVVTKDVVKTREDMTVIAESPAGRRIVQFADGTRFVSNVQDHEQSVTTVVSSSSSSSSPTLLSSGAPAALTPSNSNNSLPVSIQASPASSARPSSSNLTVPHATAGAATAAAAAASTTAATTTTTANTHTSSSSSLTSPSISRSLPRCATTRIAHPLFEIVQFTSDLAVVDCGSSGVVEFQASSGHVRVRSAASRLSVSVSGDVTLATSEASSDALCSVNFLEGTMQCGNEFKVDQSYALTPIGDHSAASQQQQQLLFSRFFVMHSDGSAEELVEASSVDKAVAAASAAKSSSYVTRQAIEQEPGMSYLNIMQELQAVDAQTRAYGNDPLWPVSLNRPSASSSSAPPSSSSSSSSRSAVRCRQLLSYPELTGDVREKVHAAQKQLSAFLTQAENRAKDVDPRSEEDREKAQAIADKVAKLDLFLKSDKAIVDK